MQKLLIILCSLLCLTSCGTKNPEQTAQLSADSTKNEFLITSNHVGEIKKRLTLSDIYSMLPENQIKKIAPGKKDATDKSDDYYIYSDKNKLLYVITPEKKDDENAKINRILIKDSRFHTAKGIGLNSTVGQIEKAYPDYDFIPVDNEIILFVPEVNSYFQVNKKDVPAGWFNESTGSVYADSIPGNIGIASMTVYWHSTKSNIVSGGFWKDLSHRFLNWVFIELPSIAILIFLFIGLLRLQIFIIHRVKKVALNRAYKAEGVDNDEAEKRINTLSGIMHGIGKIFLWTIFVLILLGKFNINIAPILASAGIVGLAVGFGAQELVRDFISGFFILLEDQVRTGDVAIINGTTGTVEKIEMRTLTLRDNSGVVHIFQNGKINSLSNMTKGWSAIVLDIGVAYKEDTDEVSDVMRQVGAEMFKDSNISSKMLEPVEVLGVDQLGDSAVIIKVKLKTKASQQWVVSREYLRRIKKAFDERNIEIPFPHLSLYVGEATKPLPVEIRKDKE